MLELRYNDWVVELTKIVDEVYDITLREFCEVKVLPKYYGLGYNPLEAFEELEHVYNKD